MEIVSIFLLAFFIVLTSLSGVFFLSKKYKSFLDKNLLYFISFSAGIFSIISMHLIWESFQLSKSVILTLGMVLTGFLFFIILSKIFPEMHHHHDDNYCHHKNSGKKIIIGDSLHGITDGFILTSSFLVNPFFGVIIAGSIFIHEVLQEISEFFVLKQAGYSTKKAILINFLTSTTIFLGIFLALIFKDLILIQSIILGLSAGFFLNVVFFDLLPHRHDVNKTENIKSIILLFIGLIIMTTILLLIHLFF